MIGDRVRIKVNNVPSLEIVGQLAEIVKYPDMVGLVRVKILTGKWKDKEVDLLPNTFINLDDFNRIEKL